VSDSPLRVAIITGSTREGRFGPTVARWFVTQARTIVQAAPAHVESVRRHLIDLLSDEQIDVLGTVADTVLHHLARLDAQG
jgi:NAD(P)H-dependent FMN reductase